MTLLKDNNYREINAALLSLAADINKITNLDTSVIDKQLAEINNRIDKINAGGNNTSAAINDIRYEIEDINSKLKVNSSKIENIEQKLSDIFSAESKVTDFNTTTDSGIYYWVDDAANRPTDYGVLLVNKYDGGDSATSIWINQIAYGTNGKIYFRQNINSGNWTEWKAVAFDGEITANKVANALTVNGKTYDGSEAVDAGVQTVENGGTGVTTQADINKAFIGNLAVGNDNVTDGTEFVSSWASDNGFAETTDGAVNVPFKRQFVKVWNYIKGKISSVLGLTKDTYGGTAAAILDYVKGTPIKVRWGGSGIDSAEWYPAFNADGSALEPINRTNIHAGTADCARNMYYQNLDLSALDKTKFYPLVSLPSFAFAEVAIHSENGPGSMDYNQNRIHFDMSTHGWTDLPPTLNIREYACFDNNEITIGCIGRGVHSGAWAIWLRGGLHYVCFSRDCNLSLKTSDYTSGDEVYTVGTNYYGGSNTNVSIWFTPQSTITEGAYSSRPITANFIGNLTGNVTGSSGSCTGISAKSSFLDEYAGAGSTRITSLNIVPKDSSEYGGMRKDVVTYSTTDSGRPSQDGHLLTMFWDNSGRYDSQFFVSNSTPLTLKARFKADTADYGAWTDIITSNNIGSQTVARASTADKAIRLSPFAFWPQPYVYDETNGIRLYVFKITMTSYFNSILVQIYDDINYAKCRRYILGLWHVPNYGYNVNVTDLGGTKDNGLKVWMGTDGNVYLQADVYWTSRISFSYLDELTDVTITKIGTAKYGSNKDVDGTVLFTPLTDPITDSGYIRGAPDLSSASIGYQCLKANITGNVSGSSGSCTGNSATADKVNHALTINGQPFDGSSAVDISIYSAYDHVVHDGASLLEWANCTDGSMKKVLIKSGTYNMTKGVDLSKAGTGYVLAEQGAVINSKVPIAFTATSGKTTIHNLNVICGPSSDNSCAFSAGDVLNLILYGCSASYATNTVTVNRSLFSKCTCYNCHYNSTYSSSNSSMSIKVFYQCYCYNCICKQTIAANSSSAVSFAEQSYFYKESVCVSCDAELSTSRNIKAATPSFACYNNCWDRCVGCLSTINVNSKALTVYSTLYGFLRCQHMSSCKETHTVGYSNIKGVVQCIYISSTSAVSGESNTNVGNSCDI